MSLQGRDLRQEFRQDAAEFGPQGVGGVLHFGGGHPDGHDIVGVHFVNRDRQGAGYFLLPESLDPQGVKIGDQGRNLVGFYKPGNFCARGALEQGKGDLISPQVQGHLFKTLEQEMIVP